jgi:hypothetical protein
MDLSPAAPCSHQDLHALPCYHIFRHLRECLGVEELLTERHSIFATPEIQCSGILNDSAPWTVRKTTYQGSARQKWWSSELNDLYIFLLRHASERCGAEWDAKFLRDKIVRYIKSIVRFS